MPGYARAGQRARGYPSDLTDAQWQVIAPHLPPEVPGRRGRPRIWPLRRIVEGILYLDRTGCAWRYLPDSFPPGRRCTGTSPPGAMTAPWRGCTTRCAPRSAPPPAGTASPPRR